MQNEAPARRRSLRQVQRDVTRRRITDAARARFYAEGVAETSVEQIAQAAGVSRATLYLHFPNKDSILLALLEANLRAVRRLYRGLRERQNHDVVAVRAWLEDYAEKLREHRQAMRLFHVGIANVDVARALIDDHRDAIVEMMAQRFPAFSRDHAEGAARHARAILVLARLDHVASAAAEDRPRIDVLAGMQMAAEELASLFEANPQRVGPE